MPSLSCGWAQSSCTAFVPVHKDLVRVTRDLTLLSDYHGKEGTHHRNQGRQRRPISGPTTPYIRSPGCYRCGTMPNK